MIVAYMVVINNRKTPTKSNEIEKPEFNEQCLYTREMMCSHCVSVFLCVSVCVWNRHKGIWEIPKSHYNGTSSSQRTWDCYNIQRNYHWSLATICMLRKLRAFHQRTRCTWARNYCMQIKRTSTRMTSNKQQNKNSSILLMIDLKIEPHSIATEKKKTYTVWPNG